MRRTLPPLNALRAFDAAGRHESFSRAAEELGVSHSAISRHVRGLEARLGVQLFKEEARGVGLTPDGHAYLDRIAPALEAIGEATEALGEAPDSRVTVNAEVLFSHQIILPSLVDFTDQHRTVELRIDSSAFLADIDKYEADYAVRFVRSGVPDRPADLLSAAPMFVYAAPHMFGGQVPSASQIVASRLLQDRRNDIWQSWFEAAGHGADWRDEETSWRMTAPSALQAALGGYGVFLGAADAVQRSCQLGQLRRITDVSISEGAFYLISRREGRRNKAQRAVREWLLDLTARFRTPGFWEEDQPIG
ncbi:MAG: LysR family transcriptional regulator [Rhodobacteraceae bacterium]|nr:LysR family transcriptional regulator [Paracoccaceae bacterium]